MRIALIIVLIIALFTGILAPAVANDLQVSSDKKTHFSKLQWSDDQKAQMGTLLIQMLELKKTVVNDNLKKGTISEEQANKMLEKINRKLDAVKSGNYKNIDKIHSR